MPHGDDRSRVALAFILATSRVERLYLAAFGLQSTREVLLAPTGNPRQRSANGTEGEFAAAQQRASAAGARASVPIDALYQLAAGRFWHVFTLA
jgi:hypothetical protein